MTPRHLVSCRDRPRLVYICRSAAPRHRPHCQSPSVARMSEAKSGTASSLTPHFASRHERYSLQRLFTQHCADGRMIDVNQIRGPNIALRGLTKADAPYTMYYDETNNIRRLHLRADGLNVPEPKCFVIAGIAHRGSV